MAVWKKLDPFAFYIPVKESKANQLWKHCKLLLLRKNAIKTNMTVIHVMTQKYTLKSLNFLYDFCRLLSDMPLGIVGICWYTTHPNDW